MNPLYLKKSLWLLTPLFGTLLFIAFYIGATFLYPGGSPVDEHAVGFSWLNNYWCNLLGDKALNGQPNPAKPVAVAGMFILCVSLGVFWYLFTKSGAIGRGLRVSIRVAGTLAVMAIFSLFLPINHDSLTNLASVSGLVTLTGVFIGLRRLRWPGLFWFGVANLFLIAANNYIYYTRDLIAYLPLIQKLTFASFLTWICCLTVKSFRLPEAAA